MVDRRQPPRRIDAPEPCWVRVRTERKGRYHGARIFHCMGILMAEIAGVPADPFHVWSSGDRISEKEYDALIKAASEPPPF